MTQPDVFFLSFTRFSLSLNSRHNQYGFKQSTRKLDGVQDIQKQVGNTIRALRLKRSLTQDIFAERSGLHRAHVGEIERGESSVTIQNAQDHCRYAGSEDQGLSKKRVSFRVAARRVGSQRNKARTLAGLKKTRF